MIVEYASYGIGNIDYDAKTVISPDWAILTGIAPQHLELFGSLENIVTAKLELVGNVPSDAPVFFNADDARLSNAIANLNRENTVGYSAADITSHMDTLSWKDELKGKLLQKMFATNVAAAIAVAKACDISDADIVRGIEDISWLPRTLEPRSLQHFELIDDSYSCNPYWFEKLIDFLSDLDFSQKVLITSGVIELGAESDRINSALSQLAQKVFDVVFITSSSLSTAWGADEENNVIHSSVEDMLPLIKEKTQKKSLIVLEGRVPSMVRNYILDDLSQQIA